MVKMGAGGAGRGAAVAGLATVPRPGTPGYSSPRKREEQKMAGRAASPAARDPPILRTEDTARPALGLYTSPRSVVNSRQQGVKRSLAMAVHGGGGNSPADWQPAHPALPKVTAGQASPPLHLYLPALLSVQHLYTALHYCN